MSRGASASASAWRQPASSAGSSGASILEMAQEGNYDLIVLGEKARTSLVEFFLGSTAYNVSRRSPCSVVLAK